MSEARGAVRYWSPVPLGPGHSIAGFDSGSPELDDWLKHRARHNIATGASAVFVSLAGPKPSSGDVAGFYSLSTGALLRQDLPKAMRRNTPGVIPVLLLGRLAVDRRHQGKGLGASLVKDCLARCRSLSVHVGFMGVVVHPIDQAARDFWLHLGWVELADTGDALILPSNQLGAVAIHPASAPNSDPSGS